MCGGGLFFYGFIEVHLGGLDAWKVNSGKPDAFMHSENIIDRGVRDEIKVGENSVGRGGVGRRFHE
eukprot:6476120-Amphidinium_carterae.2